MPGIPAEHLPLLDAIIAGAVAWGRPAEIAAAVGRTEAETLDRLADLDARGIVAVWETEAGPAVTLTPLGAARLGVAIEETGRAETPQWRPAAGDAPHRRPRPGRDRGAWLNAIEDPAPGPDAVEPDAPETTAAGRTPPDAGRNPSPFPTVLIGSGLTPWPGPREALDPCPGCSGRDLGPSEYCLVCDRWGLDHRPAAARPPRTARSPRDTRADADRQRQRRKARRKARNAAGRPDRTAR